jgi:hypothetical protein
MVCDICHTFSYLSAGAQVEVSCPGIGFCKDRKNDSGRTSDFRGRDEVAVVDVSLMLLSLELQLLLQVLVLSFVCVRE